MKCNGKTLQVIAQELQAFFPARDLETKPNRFVKTQRGLQAIMLTYVTNRAIQARLDKVCGPGNWQNGYAQWGQKGVLCKIGVRFVDDAGNFEWVWKYDGADQTQVEATKGGFSGAMKRAACQWGIGRYLYEFPEIWAPAEEVNRNGKARQFVKRGWVPQFPKEFLPSKDTSKGIVEDQAHPEEVGDDGPPKTATEHFSDLPPAEQSGAPIENAKGALTEPPPLKFPGWDLGLGDPNDESKPPGWIEKVVQFGKFEGKPWSYFYVGDEDNGWKEPDGPDSGRWSYLTWFLAQEFKPSGWKARQAMCSLLHKLEKGTWLTNEKDALAWALHCHEKAWRSQQK